MHNKLKKYKKIYIINEVFCFIEIILMMIIAACKPLNLIFMHEMYSKEDKIGLLLCFAFVTLFISFLYNHKKYSVYEYLYRYLYRYLKHKRTVK